MDNNRKRNVDALERLLADSDQLQEVSDADLDLVSGASKGHATCVMSGSACCSAPCAEKTLQTSEINQLIYPSDLNFTTTMLRSF